MKDFWNHLWSGDNSTVNTAAILAMAMAAGDHAGLRLCHLSCVHSAQGY